MTLTEEGVEVRVEVRNVAGGTDEGEDLPVGVGALPEIPGVAGDVQAAKDMLADRLNTSRTSAIRKVLVDRSLTLRDQRARSYCARCEHHATCNQAENVHLV